MSEHEEMNSLLPEYTAGGLSEYQRQSIESHLETCDECRADLAFWKMISSETRLVNQGVSVQQQVLEKALTEIHASQRKPGMIRQGWILLRSQIPLVRHEIWPASAAIMIIGYFAAILVGKEVIIQVLAPMVAAASIAMIFGPSNDPVSELMGSVPTSPRQILLARLSIVFGYNLLLSLIASVCLLPVFPALLLPQLVMSWLAPMTFISALALFLSIYFGTENAIIVAYGVWILKYAFLGIFSVNLIQPGSSILTLFNGYWQFWQHPTWMIAVGILLLIGAVWAAGKVEYRSLDLA